MPDEFDLLVADADADGHRNMYRLAAEFAETPAMFHVVVAAFVDGTLAGIGAITDEPTPTAHPAWRMRRFHVLRRFRQRGVARAIAEALLRDATATVATVTVHAGNPGAAQFWQALGFRAVDGQAWTHQVTFL